MFWHWRSVEREVGRALGRAYPWLLRVQRLPGAGLFAPCGWVHDEQAANGDEF